MATLAAVTVIPDTPPAGGGQDGISTPAEAIPTKATVVAEATGISDGEGCTNKLRFLRDVTVPDNTRIPAGEEFEKTWRVRNVGTCLWSIGYQLIFRSGHIMNGPAGGIPLPAEVPPGGEVNLSVELVAPSMRGKYQGYWLLRNEEGVEFGYGEDANEAFWVQIRVVPAATATPGDGDEPRP